MPPQRPLPPAIRTSSPIKANQFEIGSEWYFSDASLYFENPRLSVRVSYNFRSQAFGDLTMGSQIENGSRYSIGARYKF